MCMCPIMNGEGTTQPAQSGKSLNSKATVASARGFNNNTNTNNNTNKTNKRELEREKQQKRRLYPH